jgi:hypothetical protein
MMFPLVRDLAAEKTPVRLICGVLGFSPQAYYEWLGHTNRTTQRFARSLASSGALRRRSPRVHRACLSATNNRGLSGVEHLQSVHEA